MLPDIVMVESAKEYEALSRAKEASLRELAELCGEGGVPVRITDPGNSNIEDIFQGCSYKILPQSTQYGPKLWPLARFSHPRILVTGGAVGVWQPENFKEALDSTGIKMSDLATEDSGSEQPYAVTGLCVPTRAAEIYSYLLKKKNPPSVYIDPRTAVLTTDSLDSNSLYLVVGLLYSSRSGLTGIEPQPLCQKVPRGLHAGPVTWK